MKDIKNQTTQKYMNHMYHWVRHIYDASRKHYLVGRDEMIDELNTKQGDHICEVGCGTARNLIKIAWHYPQAHLYGLDVSDEMLKTAHHSLMKCGLEKQIKIRQADARSFDAYKDFSLEQKFDKIFFSYTLSLVPFWQECLNHAITQLNQEGELHIVDFISVKSHPLWIRKFMAPWLKMFHIYIDTGIQKYLRYMEDQGFGKIIRITYIQKRACIVVFRKNKTIL